jgi:hypothetical protein
MEEHILKNVSYAKMVAKELYLKGERVNLPRLILNPLWHFLKVFLFKGGFLEGYRGFIISTVGAFYTFLKYAFLLELELKEVFGDKLWKRKG